MTRVLALCSAVDPTGSVKQFDHARPLLGERFGVVRHSLPADVCGLLAGLQPDLIHTLGAEAFRAVRKVALANVRPGASSLPPWLAAGATAVEPTLGFAPGLTATFSQSEHERDWAARLVPAPMQFSGRVAVAGTALTPQPPLPHGERGGKTHPHSRYRERGLGGEGVSTVLACGGFDAVANLKHLVWAFDVLKYPHPDLHLVLLGDGPLRPEVERLARSLAFDDLRVRCVGYQHDITPLLRHAVQAWGSHTRGGTKFLLEAMAAGVPVVATRTPDTEVILSGGCGRLVPGGRPVEMAREAHRLLTSPDEARALVVVGEAAATRHPVADLAEALAGVYDSLTSSASPRHE